MAKRRGRARAALRGRTVLAMAMIGFVLIAAGVIWRRATGIERAQEIRALESRLSELEAQRVKLREEIRNASSRSVLLPIAQNRLNMHVAADSQIVILQRPPKPR
ncbi:MAG: hypothetical protein M3081_07410 [Gemmatimonadota bacterium]|nr:hypothetical protein [Gemmatimonadota bacterium]